MKAIVFVTGVLCAVAFAPAAAETPISASLGIHVPTGNGLSGTLTDLRVNYDFGPRTIIPVRTSFQFDYASGNGNGANQRFYGLGLAARLTTPIYAGAGASIYDVNGVAKGAGNLVRSSGSGFGTNIFVGNHLVSIPGGVSLSLEGGYKSLPAVRGLNLSGFGVGLRAQL